MSADRLNRLVAGLTRIGAKRHLARIKYWFDAELRRRNRSLTTSPPDSLPVPPPDLVFAVSGHRNLEQFLRTGARSYEAIRTTLSRNRTTEKPLTAVLDFGCGCGRVVRYWKDESAIDMRGCDYNSRLVAWCRKALGFASFDVNSLGPPLPYEAGTFDLVYALSVFTHLPDELQVPWIDELHRVLTPDGYAYLTVHGETSKDQLTSSEIGSFDAGELVVRNRYRAGENYCSSFHPDAYVRRVWLRDRFDVVDRAPKGEGGVQDVYLLRRR